MRWPRNGLRLLAAVTASAALLVLFVLFAAPFPPAPQSIKRCRNVVAVSVFNVPFDRDATAAEVAALLASSTWTPPLVNKYTTPLVNAVLNWRWLLPDWCVRAYVARGHPIVRPLRRLGAEVVEMDFEPARWVAAMTWRFLPEDDAGRVDRWASREADSPPTYQDAAALRVWERSGAAVSALHLRGPHMTWNGGTWAVRRGFLTHGALRNATMAEALAQHRAHIDATRPDAPFGARYGDDQGFMSTLWPRINMSADGVAYVEESVRANRTLCYFRECTRWPPYPGSPDGFLACMNSVWSNQLILCHYRTPPYCRKVQYAPDVEAWRRLYEVCVGRDFDTDAPLAPGAAPGLPDLPTCPYGPGTDPLPF